jgi:RNA polymerase-binding protein DksA
MATGKKTSGKNTTNTGSSQKSAPKNSGRKGVRKAVEVPAHSPPADAKAEEKPKVSLPREKLDHYRKKLQTERMKVLEEMGELQSSNLKQSISDQSGEISRYSYHLGDTASLSYGREFSMGLAERQQKYLEQIDEALERVADGTYGICRVTGEPIPDERLEEVPVAKYSVKGKEILAKKRR